jgi:hypothetical protein
VRRDRSQEREPLLEAQKEAEVLVVELFTSRWANKDLADLVCQPVGISRGTPRFSTGYRYRLLRELAPDDKTWGSLDDPDAFRTSYLDQLKRIGADAILARLDGVSGGLPIVMLCYENVLKGELCHRRYLAAFLEQEAGVPVPEWAPGMIPRHPDAPQPNLF